MKRIRESKAVRIAVCCALLAGLTVTSLGAGLIFEGSVDTAQAAVRKNEPVFKYLAPKSQTKYKEVYKVSRSVKSLRREGRKIKAASGYVTAYGAVIAPFSKTIGTVSSVYGSIMYLVGDRQVSSFKYLKSNVRYVVKVDFKWTDTRKYPLKGTFRIKTYFTYRGKRVSSIKTSYQKREFGYGERW
jgi:hypothetical protein